MNSALSVGMAILMSGISRRALALAIWIFSLGGGPTRVHGQMASVREVILDTLIVGAVPTGS